MAEKFDGKPGWLNNENAQKEANRLRLLVPKENSTRDDYEQAKDYLIDRKKIRAGLRRINPHPNPEEIKAFEVTQEIWEEAKKYFEEKLNNFIQGAMEERDKAVSHRPKPFKVGAIVLAIEPGKGGQAHYQTYPGRNFTLRPGEIEPNTGRNKRCAERGGTEVAEVRAKVIVGIVIVCKQYDTGDGNESTRTLHPCRECRTLYKNLLKRGLMREDTILCGVNDSESQLVVEKMTLKELLEKYPAA